MTDTFDLAAMIADREAGTPGRWIGRDGSLIPVGKDSDWAIAAFYNDTKPEDARRIARVPEMEAEILRLREGLTEIERLYNEVMGASWRAAQMRAIAQEMLK